MSEQFPAGAALVFGGSGGIGSVVARGLAQSGSNVAITYNSKSDAADRLVEEISGLGARASAHRANVTDPAQVSAAFDAAVAEHGRIHTLVWAVGPLVDQVLLSETSDEQWRRAIDTEVNGFFTASRIAIPYFRQHGGGSFVTLGSAGDKRWPARDGLSVAPKAAIESLVRGIAVEEGLHGIRANSVLVGVIAAGMFLELVEQGVFDEAWVAETMKMLPLKRWGKPEEIADAVVFLASNRASYVTGQSINVSGGFGV